MWFLSSCLSQICTWGVLSQHVRSPDTLKLSLKDHIERLYRERNYRTLGSSNLSGINNQTCEWLIFQMILVPGFKLPHRGKAFHCALSEPLTHSTWEHNQWLFYITRFQSNLLSSQSNWNRKGGYYLHYKLWDRTQSYKGNFANIWLTHYMLILLVLLSELWDAQKMLGS